MQITICKWCVKGEEESNYNLVAIILLVLLFPIRNQLKEGGTIEYKALVYKALKVKKLISKEEMEWEGKIKECDYEIKIEILGFEIYNNVK